MTTPREPVRPEIMAEVEFAMLTSRGLTPAEVHKRVGRWALVTIRHALRELAAAGRVTFAGPAGRRRYRRLSPGNKRVA